MKTITVIIILFCCVSVYGQTNEFYDSTVQFEYRYYDTRPCQPCPVNYKALEQPKQLSPYENFKNNPVIVIDESDSLWFDKFKGNRELIEEQKTEFKEIL